MENERKVYSINITTMTVVKIILLFLLLYFVYLIRDILAMLFVALIVASAIDPFVDWMQGKRIPRPIGVLLIYILLFSIVGVMIYLIIPPIAQETGNLSEKFPLYLDRITSGYSTLKQYSSDYGFLDNIKNSLSAMSNNLQNAAGGVFATVIGIFGGIFSFFLVLVLTFYMAVEENAIKKIVWSLAPVDKQPYIMNLMNRMQKKIGLWLRGQMILCLIIFALTFVGLKILGVEYALILALIAGLTEFVPYLGPMIGAIPAVFLALAQSPILALFVAALYYIVQWFENNILVPKVMQKTVGLNPIVSISVLLIGFQLAGIVGAILSIPVATAISVFVKDLFEGKATMESNLE
jgi:predicted PurR-regulated permease PerM